MSVVQGLCAALGRGEELVLDLHVYSNAHRALARVPRPRTVIRRMPDEGRLARIRRRLGFFLQRDGLCAAIAIADPADFDILRDGNIWEADFFLYPAVLAEVPRDDPHERSCPVIGSRPWSLAQETGVPDWILAADSTTMMDLALATVKSEFANRALDLTVL